MSVSLPEYPVPLDAPVVSTSPMCRTQFLNAPLQLGSTKELPKLFAYQTDMNAGDPIGVGMASPFPLSDLADSMYSRLGWAPEAVSNGTRSSSATSYLTPAILSRPNLSVLLHAQATKLVRTGTREGRPLFGAVEFARNATCNALLAGFPQQPWLTDPSQHRGTSSRCGRRLFCPPAP